MSRSSDRQQFRGETYEDRMLSEDWDPDTDDEEPGGPCCNRCGSADVRWRQQGGKWVLFSLQPGVEHKCPIPDGFDVVPE